MSKIVVVGSTMIDMITYTKKIPGAGQTIQGDTFVLGFGGKGANQAIMARRLGAEVYMVNTVGDDLFGESYLKNFRDEGIDTTYVATTTGASGVAPIWVEPNGTNRIICVAGANNAMTPAQGVEAIENISDISVVIGQLEIPQNVTIAAFQAARKKGAVTILNPAPFASLSKELIAASDWIIPNESEFAGLHPQNKMPDSDEIIKQLAEILGKRLVVTLGEAGAAFTTTQGLVKRVSAPAVLARDTTGAGDAFVGAFSVGLAMGLDDAKAIELGCLCASDSVTRLGTQSSYPSREQGLLLLEKVK